MLFLRRQLITAAVVGALLSPAVAHAGAGYIITESGTPSKWDISSSIPIHPESGECGSFSNAQMLTKIQENLGHWTDLSEINFNFSLTTGSVNGVDGCNYGDYLIGVTGSNNSVALGDGFNPIIFDNDGEIVSAVAGVANRFRVLGFANPAGFSTDFSEIVDGQAVFNCFCLEGNDFGPCTAGSQTITFSEDELDFTMVHEMGHFMNLDHTQVNCTGDGADNLCEDGDTSNDDNIPTMYPVSENAAQQITPMQDDISALAGIYPATGVNGDHCRVTGSIFYSDGTHALRCADVQAIPSDVSKSVAFVSGAYAPAEDNNGDGDTADSGECNSNCGDFELLLDPGLAYTIQVRPINSNFTGGSGISPCANGQLDNIESETLGSVTAVQCTAGAEIDLGALTTTSTYSSSDTGGVAARVSYTPNEYDDEFGNDSFFETDYATENNLPPQILGGSPQQQTSEDCPESGGSSGGGSGSSSSSGGSSGCQLSSGSLLPSVGIWITLLSLCPILMLRLGHKRHD